MSIYNIFESGAIAGYWDDIRGVVGADLLGEKYFPASKQTGLTLGWIRGRNNIPVALQPTSFDTKAVVRDRIGVKEITTEMPFFREAMRIGEKDRQDIEILLGKGEQFAQPVIMRIFDDAKTLIDGALVQSERMRMSLLYSGAIGITSSSDSGRNVDYTYNYDGDSTWANTNTVTLGTDAKWTAAKTATSDPIGDLVSAVESLSVRRGIIATEVLMNTTTFKGLLSSASVKNIDGYSRSTVKQFIEDETGLKVILYDKIFKDENGNDVKYFPDGYATVLPGHALGNTWYGTTPEEFDLMSGNTNASVSVVNTGVAVTTIKEAHPVNVQTIVSEIVLPSFEGMDDIYVIKAF